MAPGLQWSSMQMARNWNINERIHESTSIDDDDGGGMVNFSMSTFE